MSSCEGSRGPTGICRRGPWAWVLKLLQTAGQSAGVYWACWFVFLGGVKLRGLHAPPEPGLREDLPEGRNPPRLPGSLPGPGSLVHMYVRRTACWAGSFSTALFSPNPKRPNWTVPFESWTALFPDLTSSRASGPAVRPEPYLPPARRSLWGSCSGS